MEYFVYKYWFKDNTVYIGRSQVNFNRFGHPEKYKDQEVYKHLVDPEQWSEDAAQIIFRTENAFEVCYMEHQYILAYYDISHNGSTEEDWFITACKMYKNDYATLWQDFNKFTVKYPFWCYADHLEELPVWKNLI